MDDFHFEADAAAFPIIASHWDDNIDAARVYYQNSKASELYGELRGQLLVDLFGEVLRLSKFETEHKGHALMQRLNQDHCIKSVNGTLAGKRVEMFSSVLHCTENTIQSTIIDVTDRFMDTLSGIPGRELFYDHLDVELMRAQREKSEVHICFVDLDGFKQTNDLYGHQAGDDVIVEVGKRLKALVRKHETVSRFGGDEFVLLLSAAKVDSLFFAEHKLIPMLNKPYLGAGHNIDFIGASVGIASAPKHATDSDELVNHADDAMYVAKSRGKNQAVEFAHGMEGMKKH
ncbi:MAG: diguanylate cyclase domain-containing protein [Mariprofundus sp.]